MPMYMIVLLKKWELINMINVDLRKIGSHGPSSKGFFDSWEFHCEIEIQWKFSWSCLIDGIIYPTGTNVTLNQASWNSLHYGQREFIFK
jgi:hypothetical protein